MASFYNPMMPQFMQQMAAGGQFGHFPQQFGGDNNGYQFDDYQQQKPHDTSYNKQPEV